MKTVIVATNFSPSCSNAAHYAADLSKQMGIKQIVLYHSYSLPLAVELPLLDANDSNFLYNNSMTKLILLREELAAIVPDGTDIITVSNDKTLLSGVNELFDQYPQSLLVIGASEKRKAESVLVGSNTASLIRQERLPVLIIPNQSSYKPIRKVVYACDLKRISDEELEKWIKSFIEKLRAHLIILNVSHDEADNFKPNIVDDIYKLHSIWEDKKPDYHFLERKNIVKGIIQFAEIQEADLIIAVPKTYSFLNQLFHKSISNKLASNSYLPLLLLREN